MVALQWVLCARDLKTALDLFLVGVSPDIAVKLAVNFSNVSMLGRTGALKNGGWNIYVYFG